MITDKKRNCTENEMFIQHWDESRDFYIIVKGAR